MEGTEKGTFLILSPLMSRVAGARFKALLIEQDDLLLVVLRHIEPNPVRAGLVATDGHVQFGLCDCMRIGFSG